MIFQGNWKMFPEKFRRKFLFFIIFLVEQPSVRFDRVRNKKNYSEIPNRTPAFMFEQGNSRVSKKFKLRFL